MAFLYLLKNKVLKFSADFSKSFFFYTNHKYIVFTVITFFCPYFNFYKDNFYVYNIMSYTLIMILFLA
jgi:hypothetical protein